MEKVLRASKAGFPCLGNLWYSVNSQANGYEPNISTRTQRIFDVGTCLEPQIVKWLEDDGWEVKYNPGSQEAEIEVTVNVKGGMLAGHPDCIISKGDIQNALVDIKTMNDRAFRQWKTEGSLKAKPQYVIQLHIYAMGLIIQGADIRTLGIVGMNKNNSDLHIDFFPFDEDTAMKIVERAEYIVNTETPPEYGCPSEAWACSYCEFSHICTLRHAPVLPEPVGLGSIPVTQDETVINAMKALQHARELSKQARELETDAKDTLDENVKDKGLSGIQGGGFLFSMKERMSSRFDAKAFRDAHPELAGEFTKTVPTVIYDVERIEIPEALKYEDDNED